MKKYVFSLVIILIIISSVFIYLNFFKTSEYKDIESMETKSQIDFKDGIISIKSKDKICNIDSDCTIIQSDCGDCNFDTVSKNKLSTYSDAKNKYCTKNKPRSYCDSDFIGTAKCINKVCQISD